MREPASGSTESCLKMTKVVYELEKALSSFPYQVAKMLYRNMEGRMIPVEFNRSHRTERRAIVTCRGVCFIYCGKSPSMLLGSQRALAPHQPLDQWALRIVKVSPAV